MRTYVAVGCPSTLWRVLPQPILGHASAGVDADESGHVLRDIPEPVRRFRHGDRDVSCDRLSGFLTDPHLHPPFLDDPHLGRRDGDAGAVDRRDGSLRAITGTTDGPFLINSPTRSHGVELHTMSRFGQRSTMARRRHCRAAPKSTT